VRASVAIAAALRGVMLQGRLSRAAVGELIVELGETTTAPGLEDALRRALGDPSLELVRRETEGIALPGPRDARVATPIAYQGEEVGVLVHDRVLRLRPELLDGGSAAAGFALPNGNAPETPQ